MRIVFATQRYWPASSPTITTLDQLARGLADTELVDQEVDTMVLTGQWENHWPLELVVRDVPVIRFPMQNWSLLGRSNLGGRMADWLSQNPDSWDRLVIVGPIEGGEHLFRVARQCKKPAIVHLCETGPETLFENPELQNRARRRFATWSAHDQWITSDKTSAESLKLLNPDSKIAIWNLGLPDTKPLSLAERKDLRLALVSTHPVLRGSRFLPLVVYDGPYGDNDDTIWLWRLLQQVFARRRDFRVWLTGDGHGLPRLYHSIVADEMEDLVLIPGYFPEKADLYATADLVLFPNSQEFNSTHFSATLSTLTPSLLSEPFARRLNLFPDLNFSGIPQNWNRWADAISSHLDQPENLRQQTAVYHQVLIQNCSLSATLKSYLQILESMERY